MLSRRFLFIILLVSGMSYGGDMGKRTYPCCRFNYESEIYVREPVVDGKLDDAIWEVIPVAGGFTRNGTDIPAGKQTSFRMGYTDKDLFIGIRCEEPDMSAVKDKGVDGYGGLWGDDSVEIFLFPKGAPEYCQFIVNAAGSRWQGVGWGGKGTISDWEARSFKGKNFWSLEIRIPFAKFGAVPHAGDAWSMNIGRNTITSADDRFSSWSRLSGGFHEPSLFGVLSFTGRVLTPQERAEQEALLQGDAGGRLLREKIEVALGKMSEWKKELTGSGTVVSLRDEAARLFALAEEISARLRNPDMSPQELFGLLDRSTAMVRAADGLRARNTLRSLMK